MSRLVSLAMSVLSLIGSGFNDASGKQKAPLTIGKQGWKILVLSGTLDLLTFVDLAGVRVPGLDRH